MNDGNCLVQSGSLTAPDQAYSKHLSNSAFFVANGNQQHWYSAQKSCVDFKGQLLTSNKSEDIVKALPFISAYIEAEPIEKVGGFWIGTPDLQNKCQVLNQFGLIKSKPCSDTFDIEDSGAIYLGLCQVQKNKHEEISKGLKNNLYYTCQCPEGFGYENCTEANESQGSINFGHTFCQKKPSNVSLTPGSDQFPLIFIDHVAYGKPLKLPGSFSIACQNLYAANLDEVRSIRNSYFRYLATGLRHT